MPETIPTKPQTLLGVFRNYIELTKPRISLLLMIVAVVSYFIAATNTATLLGALITLLAVGSQSVGVFALNHYLERREDARMVRTQGRPIPSGRITPRAALVFGLVSLAASLAFCYFAANWLTFAIAAFVAASYLLVYTPLKYKTAWHTALGALPGATPPLAGWAVGLGHLDEYAWILFGILFFWQFPHFLSIEMMYRDDYARANIKVLPVVDISGRLTAWQVIVATILLIAVSLLPTLRGTSGLVYAGVALGLGIFFLAIGWRAVRSRSPRHARDLLRVSVFYLPVLFVLLTLPI